MLQNQNGTIVAGSGDAAPADLSLSGLDSISNTAGGSISASGGSHRLRKGGRSAINSRRRIGVVNQNQLDRSR